MINSYVDTNNIDISEFTTFHVQRKKLEEQGLSILEMPNMATEKVVDKIKPKTVIPLQEIKHIKEASVEENHLKRDVTDLVDQLE